METKKRLAVWPEKNKSCWLYNPVFSFNWYINVFNKGSFKIIIFGSESNLKKYKEITLKNNNIITTLNKFNMTEGLFIL